MRKFTKYFLAFPLLSILFVFIAFYNGYPLVTSDTGTYINSGWSGELPIDRPIYYGYFLRHLSLKESLWLPIIVQGAILAYLTKRLVSVLFESSSHNKWLLTFIVSILTIGLSPVSWFASQIMPDIFTAFMSLSTLLFLLDKKSKFHPFFYLCICFYSCLTHNSNFLTLLLFTLILLVYYFFIAKKNIQIKSTFYLLFIALSAITLIIITNYKHERGFTLSTTSHVFLMGKLCENGMLKVYLEEHCSKDTLNLCKYKDELPTVSWEFVWNADSPLNQIGEWEVNKSENKKIIAGIISTPKYYPKLIIKAITSTIRQISQIQVGDGLNSFGQASPPYWAISNHLPLEFQEYLSSKQSWSILKWKPFNIVYALFFLFSSILVLWFILNKGISQKLLFCYSILFLFVFLNAFITANLGNVLSRLSARLIWVIPMMNIIFIFLTLNKKQ